MRKPVFLFLFLSLNLLTIAQSGYHESIMLTTDRDLYFTGDKIWFHANATSDSKEALLSTILYVELYDQQYNSVVRNKYRITANLATGCIEIPSSVYTGNYLLRAYTRYSRNFHPQTQTTLLISIVNPQLPVPETEIKDNDQVLVVPEGTGLIAGNKTKMAVRMVPYKGIEDDEISITGSNSTPVSFCKPFSNGLALLEFTPVKGENYKLLVKRQNGIEIIKQLNVTDSEVLIKPVMSGDNLKVGIEFPSSVPAPASYRIKVLSHGGETILEKVIERSEPVTVDLNGYNDQLIYCVLYKGNEVFRVNTIFTGHPSVKQLMVSTDSVFRLREKVTPDLNLPSDFKGNFLVSVVNRAAKYTGPNQIPWYSAYNSAFFSEVMNRITQIDTAVQKQIDALMILYSHFLKNTGVQNRESNPKLQFLPEFPDAQITGSVIYKTSRQPVSDIMIYSSVLDSGNQVHLYKTGPDGRFYITLNHIQPQEHTVYISPQVTDSIEILIDSDFDARYPESAGYIPFLPDTSDLDDLNRIYRNNQLSKAFTEFTPQVTDHIHYYPIPSWDPVHTINVVDFIEMPVIEEIFSEIVPFTTVRKRSDGYSLQLYDERTRSSLDDPLVILDGIPFFDMNQLMSVTPDFVQKITLTNRLVHLGNYTLNGVIRIRTNTKNFAGLKLPATSRFVNFMGVNEQAGLLFPEHKSTETGRIPDFRTLLYWDTILKPDNTISFMTSDAKGEYVVTITFTDGDTSYIGTTHFYVR